MKTMIKRATVAMALVLGVGLARADVIIYEDTFNRTGTLNGNQLGVATGFSGTGSEGGSSTAQWAAASGYTLTANAVTASGAQCAYLPFTPQQGNVYTLTATMRGVTDWVALGFANVDFANPTVGPSNPITTRWHQINNPSPWILLRPANNASANVFYKGPGATNGSNVESNVTLGYTTGYMTMSIVLDTMTAGAWTAKMYFGDPDTTPQSGSTHTFSSWTSNAIGIGNNSNVTLYADSISLTAVIPEPATFGTVGAAALALLFRRRRMR